MRVARVSARLPSVPSGWQEGETELVARGAVIALRGSRLGRKQKRGAGVNPDFNLDIGATIEVTHWRDRRARAQYRGAPWAVELAAGEREDAHLYEVRAVLGNCLSVAPTPPA
nr:NfeD-like family protein 1 [Burkholderia mallei]